MEAHDACTTNTLPNKEQGSKSIFDTKVLLRTTASLAATPRMRDSGAENPGFSHQCGAKTAVEPIDHVP